MYFHHSLQVLSSETKLQIPLNWHWLRQRLSCVCQLPTLAQKWIPISYGYLKNKNKNDVVNKVIQELEQDLFCLKSNFKEITKAVLNSKRFRIRPTGFSSREIIFQRDQLSGKTLVIKDEGLQLEQTASRGKSHGPSTKWNEIHELILRNAPLKKYPLLIADNNRYYNPDQRDQSSSDSNDEDVRFKPPANTRYPRQERDVHQLN